MRVSCTGILRNKGFACLYLQASLSEELARLKYRLNIEVQQRAEQFFPLGTAAPTGLRESSPNREILTRLPTYLAGIRTGTLRDSDDVIRVTAVLPH